LFHCYLFFIKESESSFNLFASKIATSLSGTSSFEWTLFLITNKIKSFEDIIIELGHDPKDAKGMKPLMKKKEQDIAALRKQLKLRPTMHPQTTEVVQQK